MLWDYKIHIYDSKLKLIYVQLQLFKLLMFACQRLDMFINAF
jgi:hypothetical protein